MRRLNEMIITALGWWYFFSLYLVMSIVAITVIQVFKVGLDWRLAFGIFLKWEILLGFMAVSIAVVVHLHKYYIQRVFKLRGFLRVFVLYFIAYTLATILMAVLGQYVRIVQLVVPELEELLSFVLIMIFILRSTPQRNINDPDGPSLQTPIIAFTKDEVKPFGTFHAGMDFTKELGTPVYAAGDGKIVAAWPFRGEGNMVKIDHGDKFSTTYAQLSDIEVSYGQMVKAGDLIGHVGNTGHSFEPHLHFEVRFKNRVVDPAHYLNDFNDKAKKGKHLQKKKQQNQK